MPPGNQALLYWRGVEEKMAKKYGLFGGNLKDPMQTFEGDEMNQNAEYVYIYRREPNPRSSVDKRVQVAAIKLGDGQCVKEIG